MLPCKIFFKNLGINNSLINFSRQILIDIPSSCFNYPYSCIYKSEAINPANYHMYGDRDHFGQFSFYPIFYECYFLSFITKMITVHTSSVTNFLFKKCSMTIYNSYSSNERTFMMIVIIVALPIGIDFGKYTHNTIKTKKETKLLDDNSNAESYRNIFGNRSFSLK